MDINKSIKIIYDALNEKQAIDIKIIDISNISIMTDYIIIASANNNLQMNSLVKNIESKYDKVSNIHPKIEGKDNKSWILLDYGRIIVNIFEKESRNFYNLEHLWSDGKEVILDQE